MDSKSAGIQVRAWAAVGAMTPEAIFARLDERVARSFNDAEAAALHRNFEAICDRNGQISEAEFTTFVLSKIGLSTALTKTVHILFDSLCYLSRVPLQTISTPLTHMTIDDLKRALMWMLPGREQSVVDAIVDQRIRSPADQMRLIFQSLANFNEKFEVPLDVRAEQSLAVYNATTFPTDSIYALQNHSMHFDADGDEMYHDVLDVLVSALPYIPVGYAEPGRDTFRPLAKQLYQNAPSLYELFIPALRLGSFLSLLIATSFDGGPLNADQDLECVMRCIAASFRQQLSLEPPNAPISIVPNSGTTWPMFHLAVSKLLPHLLNSLFKLLSKVFFDGFCPDDPHLAPTAEIGVVLTLPRMAQVECILCDSMYMSDTRVFEAYSGPTLPTAIDLTHSIESTQGWLLLIISG